MDFDACFQLLAARPAHAHAHCEDGASHDERHVHEETQVQALADALDAAQLKTTADKSSCASVPTRNDTGSQRDASTSPLPPLTERSVRALAQSFFQLQETRVQVYSDFHKGFREHQQTAFFTAFSADITARFAAVSSTINSIEQTLVAKQQRVLAQCIRQVQLQEKEKLLLTSALLVEQMRLRDALRQQPEPDASITALLEQSAATLTRKLAAIVERINELLDDLRAEVIDLDDDDEEDDQQ